MEEQKEQDSNGKEEQGVVRRARRRDALNELIDDCNTVIHDKDARPETIEKAISTKAEIVFRQKDDRLSEQTREITRLQGQVTTLTAELEGTVDSPGARKQAAEYVSLVRVHKESEKTVAQKDREAREEREKVRKEHEQERIRLSVLEGFLKCAAPNFDKVSALAFFLTQMQQPRSNPEVQEIAATLGTLGISEQEIALWQGLRQRYSHSPEGKDALFERYEQVYEEERQRKKYTVEKNLNNENTLWFIEHRLEIEFKTDIATEVKLRREREAKPAWER